MGLPRNYNQNTRAELRDRTCLVNQGLVSLTGLISDLVKVMTVGGIIESQPALQKAPREWRLGHLEMDSTPVTKQNSTREIFVVPSAVKPN